MNELIDEIESYKQESSKLEELKWRNELTAGSDIDYNWKRKDGKFEWIAATVDSIDRIQRRICIKSKYYPKYSNILVQSINLSSPKIAKADTKCLVSHWRADLNVNSKVYVEYRHYGRKEKVIGTIVKEHYNKWLWLVSYTKKREYRETRQWFHNISELLYPFSDNGSDGNGVNGLTQDESWWDGLVKSIFGCAQTGVSTNYGNGNDIHNSSRSRANSFYLALLEIVVKVHVDDEQNRKFLISPKDLHYMLGKQDATCAIFVFFSLLLFFCFCFYCFIYVYKTGW